MSLLVFAFSERSLAFAWDVATDANRSFAGRGSRLIVDSMLARLTAVYKGTLLTYVPNNFIQWQRAFHHDVSIALQLWQYAVLSSSH
jgi:hypothetical protein